MMRTRLSGSLAWFVAGTIGLCAAGQATAQELAATTRTPKFLVSGPTAKSDPVEIDAARVASLRRRVSLSLNGARLGDALNAIARQAGIRFVYVQSVVPVDSIVEFQSESITVAAALTELLLDAGVNVLVTGPNQIVLVKSRIPAAPAGTIAGRITDGTTGRGLQAAEVVLEGTRWHTLSDADGQYRLAAVDAGTYTLAARRIGYGRRRQAVTVRRDSVTAVDLALEPATVNLDEVVVTGTPGGVERRAVGNAVSKIAAAEVVPSAPITDISQLIRGRAAGALVRTATGTIGGGSRINLRGAATLALNDQPLIYVDGLRVDSRVGVGIINEGSGGPNAPISRINDFSPNEIESIEIIKGPAAATLYGTDASAGVIQIITKRGSRAKTVTWDLSLRQGATWFQNPQGRFRHVFGPDASGNILDINPYELAASQGRNPFQNGHLQGYSLSLAGGTNTLTYFLSGQVDQDDGYEAAQSLSNYHGRLNLGITPNEKLNINTSLGMVHGKVRVPTDGNFGGMFFSLISGIRTSLLNTPRQGWNFGSPEAWAQGWRYFNDLDRATASAQVVYRPFRWLTNQLSIGGDLASDDFESISERMGPDLETIFSSGVAPGARRYNARTVTNTTIDYGASAEAKISKAIESKTSVGLQYYHKALREVLANGNGFPARGITTVSALATRNAEENFFENNTVGLYVQQQIGLNDRLFLTAALRADDNSAFGSEFDLATYPKASATWVISEEPFWHLPAISTLKLRGAYGASGRQPDVFDALRTFQPVSGPDNASAITPTGIGNPSLKPERGTELEVGFDAGLFKERIGVELTYYDKKTTDAIVADQLPPSGGFPGTRMLNVGEVSSKGLELMVNAHVLDSRKAKFDLAVNVATSTNEVIRTGLPGKFILLPSGQVHADGYPIASFFGRKVVSATYDAATKTVTNIRCDAGVGPNTIKDPGGAPVDCVAAAPVFLGGSLPTSFGSVSPTLTLLDRLQITALVDFQRGQNRVSWEPGSQCNVGICEEFFFPERFDIIKVAEARLRLTDFAFYDASFAKLREISVRYSFPDRLARAFGAKRASILLSGTHLHTWTSYPGLDPEPIRLSRTFDVGNLAVSPPGASFLVKIDATF